MCLQAGEGGLDVIDGEKDVADAGVLAGSCPNFGLARRRVVLRELELCVAVRGLHHRDVRPDAIEAVDPVHRAAFDGRLALQLEPERGEELGRGREVV